MSTLRYTTDGVYAEVTFDRWDAGQPDRARWIWKVSAIDDSIEAHGDDLTTVGAARPTEALRTLVSFLGAWAESSDDGENAGLFPFEPIYKSGLGDWADYATYDLNEEGDRQ